MRTSKHHVVPKSRKDKFKEFGIKNKSQASNIVIIEYCLHQKYHALFQNMTPDEILSYLNKTFWNGQFRPTL